ncbi:tRNA pseudouridine(54/55) synthase Pus10 [Staphylothermus hellenicus]|uniref:tRNA pseudouridine synthase Pus10 n=1 Tax=Staphylothermus hellenicus (strain DSM 12710 / JCM 10830 / BK20S6-10-b1 / P8) TaxID=591019 RepID=D7DAH8_STAHD|nr:tRNA pseudouridine(54/55) synthase Pus10 [Staphylothermus hellenicus]ADI31175.1 THUMP domain protein [Staphylothermus hellenicus DSM 12710]
MEESSTENQSAKIIKTAKALLARYPLCHHCLGRQFAKYGLQLKNSERGYAIKTILQMILHKELQDKIIDKETLRKYAVNAGDPITRLYEKIYEEKVEPAKCYICGNKLGEEYFEDLARKVAELLEQYNAYTFIVGVSLSQETMLREIEVSSFSGLETSESIKNEIKREVGKIVRDKYGYIPDFDRPDVMVIIDYETDMVRAVVNPILFEGRYWKRGRNISHTIWLSKTGIKEYPYSLEEFFNDRLREIFESERIVLHASGREDVDARMLGTGRPMVIEVKNPRFRYVDMDLINELLRSTLIEAEITGYSSRAKIEYLKGEGSKKRKAYKILVYTAEPITSDKLRMLEEEYRNRVIHQRTPKRILRRKKDTLRIRRVYEVKTKLLHNKLFEAIVYCDGGLYVKELVHGDDGRTTPSFSDVLGVQAYPLELDVFVVETK